MGKGRPRSGLGDGPRPTAYRAELEWLDLRRAKAGYWLWLAGGILSLVRRLLVIALLGLVVLQAAGDGVDPTALLDWLPR